MTDARTIDDGWVPLTREQFRARFFERFGDPAYDAVAAALDDVFAVAWDAYKNKRKAPRTRPAGPGFHDATYALSDDWRAAKDAIDVAAAAHDDPGTPLRLMVINASPRSQHSCPGEVSKTRRLADAAVDVVAALPGVDVDVLDLSLLTSEPLLAIHPCKGCVSTAMPLCHWPCSCYPNHALGQTNDWMNALYPRFVAVHGVVVVTPVHWYQATSPLKLLLDRLVCADGGNPDPTTTHGKKATEAKALEEKGWDYPKHLANRAIGVFAHGDVVGAEGLRRNLVDAFTDMGLVAAAAFDTYIGYGGTYAAAHDALDADDVAFVEVKNVAVAVAKTAQALRSGWTPATAGQAHPRRK